MAHIMRESYSSPSIISKLQHKNKHKIKQTILLQNKKKMVAKYFNLLPSHIQGTNIQCSDEFVSSIETQSGFKL